MREAQVRLLIVANEREIESAAEELRREGAVVQTVQADLATLEGVDQLYGKIGGRPVDALLANAGRGLGKGFLDQNFSDDPLCHRYQRYWHRLFDS
jgi:short-subunit dehydrogenase